MFQLLVSWLLTAAALVVGIDVVANAAIVGALVYNAIDAVT